METFGQGLVPGQETLAQRSSEFPGRMQLVRQTPLKFRQIPSGESTAH
jgi:hypothetical protein